MNNHLECLDYKCLWLNNLLIMYWIIVTVIIWLNCIFDPLTLAPFTKVMFPLILIGSKHTWLPNFITQISHVYFIIWLNCTYGLQLTKRTIFALQLTQTMWFWPQHGLWGGQNKLKATLLQKDLKLKSWVCKSSSVKSYNLVL